MTSDEQVHLLLTKGIEAAQAKDRKNARLLLEKAIELEPYNESAWLWLASVVDDLQEKRICLNNVLVVNPENERAQRLLEKLSDSEPTQEPTPQSAPIKATTTAEDQPTPAPPAQVSDSRVQFDVDDLRESENDNKMVYVTIGLGITAIIIAVIVLITVLGNNSQNANNAGSAPNNSGSNAISEQPTVTPRHTRQPTNTATMPPPTWTPIPSPTVVSQIPAPVHPLAPAYLAGKLILRSGTIIGDSENQPIVSMRPDGSNRRVVSVGNERGHAPVIAPSGQEYAFVKYYPGTRESMLQINTLAGDAPKTVSAYWSGIPVLGYQDEPTWSPDGQWLAFTARGLASATDDLYRALLRRGQGSPDALERLTNDDAIESGPSFSPDSRFIVYAADLTRFDPEAGTELRIFNLEANTVTNLTTNGSELIEAGPDWSPNGRFIVFHAYETGSGSHWSDTDIYLMAADGVAPPQKIIDSDSSDIHPRFSPDGQHIVFSSDRSGNWDVYIFDLVTEEMYQVTTSPDTDVANDWGP